MSAGVTFRDPELQRCFQEDGYVIFSYLTEEQLENLASLVPGPADDLGSFHWSAISNDLPYRRKVASEVLRICGPSIQGTFIDCRGVNATLLIKAADDPGGDMPPHLDWTFVEEPEFTSCTVWCPLADTSVESGGLHVLPRSHRLVNAPRGTPVLPNVFDDIPREVIFECGIHVPLKVGEAVAWDHRVLHWSPPNTTRQARIAVGMAVVPSDAELYHYVMHSDGTIHKYAVDDEEFFGRLILGEEPDARHLEQVQLPEQTLEVETVRRVCGRGLSRNGDRTHGSTARRSTFRDHEMQSRFEDTGYVTFPLFGDDELRALNELARGADFGRDAFHASATTGANEQRLRLGIGIQEICAGAIERVFDEHRLVFGSMLFKAPQDSNGMVPPHLDWTTVDESKYVGCTVWSPLADTTAENGGLYLLPRSHALVNTPRGTPFIPTPFDSLSPEQIQRYGEPVPLRAGQAVAWDQRVVHWSPSNRTEEPRIAVGIGVVPVDAQLLHFFRTPEGAVQRYAVADDFYASFQVGETPPGSILDELEVDPVPVDEPTIRRVCAGLQESEEPATAPEDVPPVPPRRRFLYELDSRVPPGLKRRVPPALRRQLRMLLGG